MKMTLQVGGKRSRFGAVGPSFHDFHEKTIARRGVPDTFFSGFYPPVSRRAFFSHTLLIPSSLLQGTISAKSEGVDTGGAGGS